MTALVEYQIHGELWRCGAFDQLTAEFELPANALEAFHGVAVACQQRQWLVVRRLFGIMPVLPPADFSPEDARQWSRQELMANLGLTRAQLKAELDAVRGSWKALAARQAAETIRPEKPAIPPAAVDERGQQEITFKGDDLLKFHELGHLRLESDEKQWFIGRVTDFDKMLRDPMAKGLAKLVLMTEVDMRRVEAVLHDPAQSKVGQDNWSKHIKLRQSLSDDYHKQLGELAKLCPWATQIAGKWSFVGTMSEITKAVQLWEANGDNRLIDGIFTATEIQVECRRSTQAPDPRYRAGLVVFLNAAKAGLWDPKWQSPFPEAKLRRIDLAWQAAMVAGSEAAGELVPDLEADGPEGEYPPLEGAGHSATPGTAG